MRDKFFILLAVLLCCLSGRAGAAETQAFFTVGEGEQIVFAESNELRAETNNLFLWRELDSLASVKGTDWRVLTSAEWTYLLLTRDTATGQLPRNAISTVVSQNGLVLVPDYWVDPIPENIDEASWAEMENAGAVFLPCDGYGYIDDDTFKHADADVHGSYWSSTEIDTNNAYRLQFDVPGYMEETASGAKSNYYSVRMVREVKITPTGEENNGEGFMVNGEWRKVMGNGVLLIERKGVCYTIDGRKI